LLLQPQDDPVVIRLWLQNFLENALKGRGFRCRLHLWEDESAGDESWPEGLSWGPPRTAEWARRELEEIAERGDEKALAKRWRGVLLCVQGPLARALLRFEQGLHRWLPSKERDDTGHLWISWCADAFILAPEALRRPDDPEKIYTFGLPSRTPRDQLDKIEACRVWRDDESLDLTEINARFPPEFKYDYWDRYENLVFELMAASLTRGADPVPEEVTR
jgi:hypothetical protein